MRLLALLMMTALVLSGCSDDEGDDPGTDPGGNPGPPDPGSGGDDGNGTSGDVRAPITWELTIQGNDFVDGSISIQVGDTVTWTTSDTVPHTVTADDGTFHSGDCPGPDCLTQANPTFSYTFDQVGEFPYHCEVHPSMTDTITVLAYPDDTA